MTLNPAIDRDPYKSKEEGHKYDSLKRIQELLCENQSLRKIIQERDARIQSLENTIRYDLKCIKKAALLQPGRRRSSKSEDDQAPTMGRPKPKDLGKPVKGTIHTSLSSSVRSSARSATTDQMSVSSSSHAHSESSNPAPRRQDPDGLLITARSAKIGDRIPSPVSLQESQSLQEHRSVASSDSQRRSTFGPSKFSPELVDQRLAQSRPGLAEKIDCDDDSTAKPAAVPLGSICASQRSLLEGASEPSEPSETESLQSQIRHVTDEQIADPYGDVGLYTGTVIHNLPHGFGTMIYNNKDYEGNWYHGQWHGRGMLRNSNGDVYKGTFRFDRRHGLGSYKWADGRVYEGNFEDDKRNGYGSLKFPDGTLYKGEFFRGARHGRGRCDFAEGGYYEGDFENNVFSGQGICQSADGSRYIGSFLNNVADGNGIEYRPDGSVLHDGLWKDDEPVYE